MRARDQLEQHDAHRPQISALVDGTEGDLLGRHIGQRADA
jgi:hypothetical protein